MLPVRQVTDYPVTEIVRHCDVCKLNAWSVMPDTVKVLREIKGDDMYMVIRLKKLGEYVKKIDDCCSGRSSWTKIKLYF